MKKIGKLILLVALIVIVLTISIIVFKINDNKNNEGEMVAISSQEELEKIYNEEIGVENSIFFRILKLPFSLIETIDNNNNYYNSNMATYDDIITADSITSSSIKNESQNTKEYSTTNIQVENVDEADITKTDGDYIYSLSEDNVIITDVKNPEDIKIITRIQADDSNTIPVDLMLYNDKLVVIYEKVKSSSSYYSRYNKTYVEVYDITNKEQPKKIKNYELPQPYYTSRCIEGKLYVIASGSLKEENEKIVTYYKEDGKEIDPGYSGIMRVKNLNTDYQTIISMYNLNEAEGLIKVSSYLMNIENAYVSENNIYLLDEKYEYNSYVPEVSDMFGVKGIFGLFDDEEDDDDKSGYYTKIYKFNILEDGTIKFDKRAEEKGRTINQFSIDEYEGNLRLALYDNDGSRVVIFDKDMKKIGETERLAEGEKMYSSRFLENKAYLVTYKTIDPLFVIDLSDSTNPKVLGELKIPGYSTYLHPYDENHIIGIGMQTEEKINRNSSGKVTSTTSTITGMKMALFDVTDVNNPIQISETIIGDRRATSAILTNHKALLFSKEKELLAIPVNNYQEDFEIESSSENYSSIINSYTSYNKNYISEGYFVYNLNLTDGFELKGTITHDKTTTNRYYYSYSNSKLLRGLYIDDNLYTISEDYIKVNRLEDLQEIEQVKIKED